MTKAQRSRVNYKGYVAVPYRKRLPGVLNGCLLNKLGRVLRTDVTDEQLIPWLAKHWMLKELSNDLILRTVHWEKDALSVLTTQGTEKLEKGMLTASGSKESCYLPRISKHSLRVKTSEATKYHYSLNQKQRAHPIVAWVLNKYYATQALKLHSKILVYLKCRGSVDAIRVLLNDQGMKYTELHVGKSFFEDRGIRKCFSDAGLPLVLPYLADGEKQMTGPLSIVQHLAKQANLCGRKENEDELLQTLSLTEFAFSVLQSLWKTEVAQKSKEMSSELAKARFCRDELQPILEQLDDMFGHLSHQSSSEQDLKTSISPTKDVRATKPRKGQWFLGEIFTVADIAAYSLLCSIQRDIGAFTIVDHSNLMALMENVEAYRPNINAFSHSSRRF